MGDKERRLARLFRAESLLSQTELAEDLGIDRALIAHYESGRIPPTREHLEGLAARARLTVAAGLQLLELADALRQPRQRPGPEAERGVGGLLAELGDTCHAHRAWKRFLHLRLPEPPPAPEDRDRAREQIELLKDLARDERLGVVRAAWDFQTWALAEQAVMASVLAKDPGEARAWAALAVEVARTVRGTEAWRNRIEGFALAQEARVLKAAGDPTAAAVAEEAERLWNAGEDPDGLLAESRGRG